MKIKLKSRREKPSMMSPQRQRGLKKRYSEVRSQVTCHNTHRRTNPSTNTQHLDHNTCEVVDSYLGPCSLNGLQNYSKGKLKHAIDGTHEAGVWWEGRVQSHFPG